MRPSSCLAVWRIHAIPDGRVTIRWPRFLSAGAAAGIARCPIAMPPDQQMWIPLLSVSLLVRAPRL